MKLSGKIALITGGSNGIGKATAAKFVAEGAFVSIADMDDAHGSKTALELGPNCSYQHVDVRKSSDIDLWVKSVLATYGQIDILVNNAGIMRDQIMVKIKEDGTVIKLSEEEFERVIDINLKGVFLCAEAVAEVMIRQKSGVILNASSIVGLDGNFGQTNYVASKAGVVGMTKVWARELGKYGIRVNAIAPGYILTDMLAQVPADVLDKMAGKVPLRRLGKPKDIANVYCFLASDEAAYISGDVIRVDGGAVAGT